MPHVVIMGAGALGNALCNIIKINAQCDQWDKNPALVARQKTLAELIPSAEYVLFCVPSQALSQALDETQSYFNKKTIVVVCTKGIEPHQKLFIDQLLKVKRIKQPTVLLYGPMLAEELAHDTGGVGIIATPNKKVFARVALLFTNSQIMVAQVSDVRGVAVLGALKNIYAIALGVAQGLGCGSNLKGALTTHAINEMKVLVTRFKGKRATLLTNAGVGDFIATAYSEVSNNVQAGKRLARNSQDNIVSEGTRALPILAEKLGSTIADFPLLNALYSIIVMHADAATAFAQFTAR